MYTNLLVLFILQFGSVSCFPQHLVSLDSLRKQENSTFHLMYGNILARKITPEKDGLTDRFSAYLYEVFTEEMGKYYNCNLPEPFYSSQTFRSALFLTTDSVVPLRVQMYWINKSGKRVHQNRLISNGVLNQFSFDLICSSDYYRVNISLIERSNNFYLYGVAGFLKGSFQSSPEALKILTFNVWNMNSRAKSQLAYSRRLERMISEIERVSPDIIGLQEVRFDSRVGEGLSPNQVEHFWRRIPGYDFVYQPANFDMSVGLAADSLEEGLVILSRYPITYWNYILLPSNSSLDVHQRICLHAQIATPIFPQLHLFLTHLSLSQELRLLAVADILRFMGRFEGSKILIGDMNAEPGSREMGDVRGSGMEDAWLVFHSEPDIRTSEKVKGKMDRFFGLTFDVTDLFLRKRIDYIYIDQSLLPNAYSVELFGVGRKPLRCLSDHLGVLLKLVGREETPSDGPREEL